MSTDVKKRDEVGIVFDGRQITIVALLAFVALGWALLQPQLDDSGTIGQTRYSIWASAFFLCVALVLFLKPAPGPLVQNLARLFWVAAYLLCMVHNYISVYIIGDGTLQGSINLLGPTILLGTAVATTLWTADILIILFGPARLRRGLLPIAIRSFIFLTFLMGMTQLRSGPVTSIGWGMAVIVLAAMVWHILPTKAAAPRVER